MYAVLIFTLMASYMYNVQGEGEGSEGKEGSLAEIQGTEEDEHGEDEYQNNTDDV